MKYLLVSSFFGFILLYSFNGYFDKKVPVGYYLPKGKQLVLNPLDLILGEKILDDGTLRKDNFDSILHIQAGFLKDSSRLYEIKKLDKNLFLLSRKTFYLNNRNYSLFVKTKGNQIVSYHRMQDFNVRDAVVSGHRLYIISDDYYKIESPWKAAYSTEITCFDHNFQEEWKVTSPRNKGHFFFGTSLRIESDTLFASLEVQREGSSTMCIRAYNLNLTKSGEIIGATGGGGYSCGPDLSALEFLALFKSNLTGKS